MEKNCKVHSNSEYNQIKAIKTSVGGHFGGSYEVYIDFENKHLTWKHSLETQAELYDKALEDDTIEKFIQDLKNLDLLNWKPKYISSSLLSGKSWSVKIEKEDEKIEKHGINEFSDQWFEFCDLIKEISGKDFH